MTEEIPKAAISPRAEAAFAAALQTGARLVILLLGLALMIYLTRHLGQAQYGQYAVAMVLMSWLSVFVAVATTSTTIRLVAGHADGQAYAAAILRAVAFFTICLAALVAVFAHTLADIIRSPQIAPLLQILCLDLVLTSIAGIYSSILVAQRRFLASSLAIVSGAATQLGAAFLLVGHGWLAAGACAASVAGSATQLIIGRAATGLPIINRDRADLAPLWGYAKLLAGTNLALRITQSMDLLAVKFFTRSSVPAGAYAGGQNISLAAMTLFLPSSGIVLQSMAQSQKKGQHAEAVRTGTLFLRIALTYGALLGALSLRADDIVALLLGPAFSSSGPVLAILLWAVAFRTLSVAGNCFIAATGKSPSIMAALLALVALGVAAYAIVVPSYGTEGAAWVALSLAAAAGIASLREGLRLTGISFPWASLQRIGAAALGAAAITSLLPAEGFMLLLNLTGACIAYMLALYAIDEWRPGRKEFLALRSALSR
jgi:O-antigen/teichoic acid export membrane protein